LIGWRYCEYDTIRLQKAEDGKLKGDKNRRHWTLIEDRKACLDGEREREEGNY